MDAYCKSNHLSIYRTIAIYIYIYIYGIAELLLPAFLNPGTVMHEKNIHSQSVRENTQGFSTYLESSCIVPTWFAD